MNGKGPHLPDETLLQLLDGELPARARTAAERHLAACAICDERQKEIDRTLEAYLQSRSEVAGEIPDAAGSRAVLKARLSAIEGHRIKPVWQTSRMAAALVYTVVLGVLVIVGTRSLHRWSVVRQITSAEPLPDRAITPGSTRQVALSELCAVERDETVRDVSSQLQSKVFREYGIDSESTADFEVDYLITPGLGGSDDVRNLWPEPHANTLWNSYVKDRLEDHLHHLVCGRKLRLEEAQADIASDWISAYKKYFHTDRPLPVKANSAVAKIR